VLDTSDSEPHPAPLDHQLDVGTAALVTQDVHVFEAHERLEDLIRVDEDEGASCFLAHTSSLKRLRPILGDAGEAAPRQNPKNRIFGVVLGCHYTNTPPTAKGQVAPIIDGGAIGLTAANAVLRTGEGDR
jgi:hypothetical protein